MSRDRSDSSDEPDPRRALEDRLRRVSNGERPYGLLLSAAADDVATAGPVWSVLRDAVGPPESMPGLRLLGALHRLALSGAAPAVAAALPTTGGSGDVRQAWAAMRDVLRADGEQIAVMVAQPVQTNEVGRCAALVGGLHEASQGLPIRLLEIGASAGLLLLPDRYAFAVGGRAWGDPASPVRFADSLYVGMRRPVLDAGVHIVDRRGCDRNPLDPRSPADRLTLQSFVWAWDVPRFERLTAALDVACTGPVVPVDRADAIDWLAEQLSVAAVGAGTVVMHSVVMQYLTPAARDELGELITQAGVAATPDAPLAWLRYEPEGDDFVVRLTTWPGGVERVLATAHPHGSWVQWDHQA